jgi:cytochrome c553
MKRFCLALALWLSGTNLSFAEESDPRQELILTEAQRHHVLSEMRALLDGTQQILSALAEEDMTRVAASAEALGLNMAHKAEDHLHHILPKEFMHLGMSLHQDFDQIAVDAKNKPAPKKILHQLSAAMGKCAACHNAYQIRTGIQDNARLDEVAQRGTHVMPFDLEQTLHVFSKTEQGGVQQVIVKDKTNTGQIELIRAHLAKIADEFKHGDYSNPATIHGDTMPGLAALRNAQPEHIQIDYTELADGAQITYTSDQPLLIHAIHQWFDAQLSDHARHAVPDHQHHLLHDK